MAGEGKQDQEIAAALGITPKKAARWRARFLSKALSGLIKDAPRPGRPRSIGSDQIAAIVHKTTLEKPANATHWSTRLMAAAAGVSEASVRRIWHAHGPKAHLLGGFKVNNNPHFAEKREAIVGLYLDPPEHAIVLCTDEKSLIQALDRTQPGLPLKKGRAGTLAHDYKRNGMTTLFAALNTPSGKVISLCQQRHRHTEWLRFLRLLDVATPPEKHLHVIGDNHATHKHAKVGRWLKRLPRFHIHYQPASG